jgi:malate dehydrogenase
MKILIIGAGNVGAHIGYLTLFSDYIDEVLIYDIQKDILKGKILDLSHSAGVLGKDIRFRAVEDLSKAEADIVVITAGMPRKEGMSRFDLLEINIGILDQIISGINKKLIAESIFIMVSNPVDVLTYYLYNKTSIDRERLIGMAGALDRGRFRYYLSKNTKEKIQGLKPQVVGSHSKDMLCLFDRSGEDIELSKKETKEAGAAILSYYKGGSAYFAPAAGVKVILDALSKPKGVSIPSVAVLDGEYGYKDIAFGVLVEISSSGIEEIVDLNLNSSEKEELDSSIAGVRDSLKFLKDKGILS